MVDRKEGEQKRVVDIVALLLNLREGMLFLKRAEGYSSPDRWDTPGGKIEKGEDLKSAVIRELKEETGLSVDSKGLKVVGDFVFDGYSGMRMHTHLYFADLRAISLSEVSISNEHTDKKAIEFYKLLDVRVRDSEELTLLTTYFLERYYERIKDLAEHPGES